MFSLYNDKKVNCLQVPCVWSLHEYYRLVRFRLKTYINIENYKYQETFFPSKWWTFLYSSSIFSLYLKYFLCTCIFDDGQTLGRCLPCWPCCTVQISTHRRLLSRFLFIVQFTSHVTCQTLLVGEIPLCRQKKIPQKNITFLPFFSLLSKSSRQVRLSSRLVKKSSRTRHSFSKSFQVPSLFKFQVHFPSFFKSSFSRHSFSPYSLLKNKIINF